jgi:hypothetical protein
MPLAIDIAPHLAAFGDDCLLNGVTVRGIFDTEAVNVFGEVISQEPSLQVAANSVCGVSAGQTLVRGHVSYVVRQILPEAPDGELVRLILARA